MALAEGIYFIMSCKAAVCVDLRAGCSDDGAPIQMWQQASFSDSRCNSFPLNQLWMVRNMAAGHFSLQNLHGGTYLDLWGGNASNATKIVGHRPEGPNGMPAPNQQWEILAAGGCYWSSPIFVYSFRLIFVY
ncbi:ricin B lectin domain-containing protein [Mycena rebaudengoi]|nr:ricin B lectin domain-containing protein [Mycena rebaudengoi]